MFLIAIYICLTAFAFVWIYYDSGTEDIFSVYGQQFQTAWEMRAWSAFAACAWRLLLLVTLVNACLWLTFLTAFHNPLRLLPVLQFGLVFGMVTATSFFIPWISVTRNRRAHRILQDAAVRLATTATEVAKQDDITGAFHPAEYETDNNWTAWHPKDELWKTEDTQATWQNITPVVYATSEVPRTLVFPVDWESFLVWGDPHTFARPGNDLPFTGPGETRFTTTSIQQLPVGKKWWILRATMFGGFLEP